MWFLPLNMEEAAIPMLPGQCEVLRGRSTSVDQATSILQNCHLIPARHGLETAPVKPLSGVNRNELRWQYQLQRATVSKLPV